ncbi:MAG: hypothetical protein RLZZ585_194 [Bacteroidota bacterium]|jgi:hypothetical protein
MKKLFVFLVLQLFIGSSKAQDNLQFNQVISNTISISGPFNSAFHSTKESIQTVTVPPGKMYKIESLKVFHQTWTSTCGNSTGSEVEGLVKLNGAYFLGQRYINTTNGYIADGFNHYEEFLQHPIWLKSGDVLTFVVRSCLTNNTCNSSTPLSGTSNFFISAIEFNNTP